MKIFQIKLLMGLVLLLGVVSLQAMRKEVSKFPFYQQAGVHQRISKHFEDEKKKIVDEYNKLLTAIRANNLAITTETPNFTYQNVQTSDDFEVLGDVVENIVEEIKQQLQLRSQQLLGSPGTKYTFFARGSVGGKGNQIIDFTATIEPTKRVLDEYVTRIQTLANELAQEEEQHVKQQGRGAEYAQKYFGAK